MELNSTPFVADLSLVAAEHDFGSTSRTQTISKTKSSGGPSRIKNRRQDKIVAMIDGYDSSITPAAAIRNITLMWLIPAVGWILLGMASLAAREPSNMANRDQLIRSLEWSCTLLLAVTFVFATIWAVKTYSNIRRLGKKPGIGFAKFFQKQLFSMIAIAIGTIGYFASANYQSSFLTVLLLGLAAVVPMFSLEGMKMFWRTSSPPIGLENALPHGALIGFGSVIAHLAALRWVLLGGDLASFSTTAFIMILAGISLGSAAFFLAPLYAQVSIRQEDRLSAIISNVDADEEASSAPVTNEQISDAWQTSEELVSFDF